MNFLFSVYISLRFRFKLTINLKTNREQNRILRKKKKNKIILKIFIMIDDFYAVYIAYPTAL